MLEVSLNKNEKIYIQIYYKLKELIEKEELKGRIFSIRELAKKLNVSNFSIIKAYEELEKDGYISIRSGSGAYVIYNKTKKFFPEDHMENEVFKFEYFNDKCNIDFSVASPSADIFPIDELKKSINDILDRDGGEALLYENPLGYIGLRESIKKQLQEEGIETEINKIQIVSGAQQGINIISEILIHSGDIVVTEDPVYKGAITSFKNNGAQIKKINLKRDGIDFNSLEKILKKEKIKFIYITSNYQNPTGIVMSDKKKIELLKLANKYNFYILEDDCNSDICFSSEKIKSIKSYDKYDKVIYIKSYSKIFMPGFRLGFIIAPNQISNSVLNRKYYSDISNSGLNQRIFQYFLEKGTWEKYIEKSKKIFMKKQLLMYKELKKIEGIKVKKPNGGMNLWIKLPYDITGEAVYIKLLKNGVKILPGTIFSEKAYNFIRMSYAQCNDSQIIEGVKLLGKVIEELK